MFACVGDAYLAGKLTILEWAVEQKYSPRLQKAALPYLSSSTIEYSSKVSQDKFTEKTRKVNALNVAKEAKRTLMNNTVNKLKNKKTDELDNYFKSDAFNRVVESMIECEEVISELEEQVGNIQGVIDKVTSSKVQIESTNRVTEKGPNGRISKLEHVIFTAANALDTGKPKDGTEDEQKQAFLMKEEERKQEEQRKQRVENKKTVQSQEDLKKSLINSILDTLNEGKPKSKSKRRSSSSRDIDYGDSDEEEEEMLIFSSNAQQESN